MKSFIFALFLFVVAFTAVPDLFAQEVLAISLMDSAETAVKVAIAAKAKGG